MADQQTIAAADATHSPAACASHRARDLVDVTRDRHFMSAEVG